MDPYQTLSFREDGGESHVEKQTETGPSKLSAASVRTVTPAVSYPAPSGTNSSGSRPRQQRAILRQASEGRLDPDAGASSFKSEYDDALQPLSAQVAGHKQSSHPSTNPLWQRRMSGRANTYGSDSSMSSVRERQIQDQKEQQRQQQQYRQLLQDEQRQRQKTQQQQYTHNVFGTLSTPSLQNFDRSSGQMDGLQQSSSGLGLNIINEAMDAVFQDQLHNNHNFASHTSQNHHNPFPPPQSERGQGQPLASRPPFPTFGEQSDPTLPYYNYQVPNSSTSQHANTANASNMAYLNQSWSMGPDLSQIQRHWSEASSAFGNTLDPSVMFQSSVSSQKNREIHPSSLPESRMISSLPRYEGGSATSPVTNLLSSPSTFDQASGFFGSDQVSNPDARDAVADTTTSSWSNAASSMPSSRRARSKHARASLDGSDLPSTSLLSPNSVESYHSFDEDGLGAFTSGAFDTSAAPFFGSVDGSGGEVGHSKDPAIARKTSRTEVTGATGSNSSDNVQQVAGGSNSNSYDAPCTGSELIRTETLNGGEVRHLCPYSSCNKHFSTSGHARRHSRIHASLRPFQCPHANCGATFTRRDNCTQHQRARHQHQLIAHRLADSDAE